MVLSCYQCNAIGTQRGPNQLRGGVTHDGAIVMAQDPAILNKARGAAPPFETPS